MAEAATPRRNRAVLSRAELSCQLTELQPRLTSVARRFSPDSAEDIVQNAFEKAWRRFDQFDGRARLSTWMHRIVVNESLMWLRSERRRFRHQQGIANDAQREAPALPDAAERLEERRSAEWLRAGMAALSPRDREILQACVLDEVPYQDYCARNGIGHAAAKSRAFRARQRLRDLLTQR